MRLIEGTLQSRLLLEAPRRLPDLRLFRRNVSVVHIEDRRIAHGIKGQCDVYGIWRGGLHIELELKRRKGKLSAEQATWRDWCQQQCVPWLELRALSGDPDIHTIDRWIIQIEATRGPR